MFSDVQRFARTLMNPELIDTIGRARQAILEHRYDATTESLALFYTRAQACLADSMQGKVFVAGVVA